MISNKFPAVQTDGLAEPSVHGFFEARPGFGIHEVIIETPVHEEQFTRLDDEQLMLVFRAYRQRMQDLDSDPRVAYAQIFKNSGVAAGASLEHAHSQLIATPIVPTQVQRELDLADQYFRRTGHCVLCDMLAEELAAGSRIVAESSHFLAFCPFASQFPYETWILPKRHESRFDRMPADELGELITRIRDVLVRVEFTLQDPAFNYLIHTAPFRTDRLPYYHWHLELFPRVSKTAGFEWGAGDYINIVAPEQAARLLRLATATRF